MLRGIVYVFPFLRGVLYWLKLSSLSFVARMYDLDFTTAVGPTMGADLECSGQSAGHSGGCDAHCDPVAAMAVLPQCLAPLTVAQVRGVSPALLAAVLRHRHVRSLPDLLCLVTDDGHVLAGLRGAAGLGFGDGDVGRGVVSQPLQTNGTAGRGHLGGSERSTGIVAGRGRPRCIAADRCLMTPGRCTTTCMPPRRARDQYPRPPAIRTRRRVLAANLTR